MKSLLVCAGAAALLWASGCSTNTTEAKAYTDGELEQMVKTRLQADAGVRRLNIAVDADGEHRAVELSGTAYSQNQRMRAVELAKGVAPDIAIADKIEVKPAEVPRDLFDDDMMRESKAEAEKMGESLGDSIDDAWIHAKLAAKLVFDGDTPQRKINVDVMNNVVTLRGTVDSQEARAEAERIAAETEGVTQVQNRLQVGKG